MTRKDYELIARVIRHEYTEAYVGAGPSLAEKSAIYCVASALANALQADNERFDRAKFLEACRV